jgi:hypothetical protein
MDDYLSKPVRTEQLAAALANCFPGGRLAESADEGLAGHGPPQQRPSVTVTV